MDMLKSSDVTLAHRHKRNSLIVFEDYVYPFGYPYAPTTTTWFVISSRDSFELQKLRKLGFPTGVPTSREIETWNDMIVNYGPIAFMMVPKD